MGVLGYGGFAKVELYENKDTGRNFAVKSVSKSGIVKMGMQDSIMEEKKSSRWPTLISSASCGRRARVLEHYILSWNHAWAATCLLPMRE